jgi:hypothetical protein
MTASAKARLVIPPVEFPHKITLPAASGAGPFYKGTLVVLDASARAAVPTAGGTGDGFTAAGLSVATQDNSAGAAGAIDIEVMPGVAPLKYQGTLPKAGQLVYVVDNQTCSITTGPTAARGKCGVVTEVRGASGSETVYVLVGPLVWAAFASAGATAAATA